jgi:hypothetical protein
MEGGTLINFRAESAKQERSICLNLDPDSNVNLSIFADLKYKGLSHSIERGKQIDCREHPQNQSSSMSDN